MYNDDYYIVNYYIDPDDRKVKYSLMNDVFITEKEALLETINMNTYMYLSGTYDFWPHEYQLFYDKHNYLRYDNYLDLFDYITLKYSNDYFDDTAMHLPIGYHYMNYNSANDVIKREINRMFGPSIYVGNGKNKSLLPGDFKVNIGGRHETELLPRNFHVNIDVNGGRKLTSSSKNGGGIFDAAKKIAKREATRTVNSLKNDASTAINETSSKLTKVVGRGGTPVASVDYGDYSDYDKIDGGGFEPRITLHDDEYTDEEREGGGNSSEEEYSDDTEHEINGGGSESDSEDFEIDLTKKVEPLEVGYSSEEETTDIESDSSDSGREYLDDNPLIIKEGRGYESIFD